MPEPRPGIARMTPPPEPPPRARSLVWPLLVLIVALVAAGAVVNYNMRQIGRSTVTAVAPSTAPAQPSSPTQMMQPPQLGAMLSGDSAAAKAAMLPPGATARQDPPADLPLYDGAKLMAGYERKLDGVTEQSGVWEIAEARAPAVLKYYYDAALKVGFASASAPAPAATLMTLRRPDGATLLVRARTVTAPRPAVRLTLIFRYTNGPSR
jgi:hypothetical protein